MAMVVIGFGALFKDLGTSAAVIQRKNVSEQLLSSIYWANVAFGLLALVATYLLSPVVASLYHEARVEPLLKILAVTLLISGLSIVHQAILERELAFNKLAKLEITATLIGSFVGIGSALLGYGAWSLVYHSLAEAATITILLWTACSWKPKLLFCWDEVKSVSSYSLNLTGFNIFNYFVRNTDYILIGRFLGARNLGYYTLAYQIMLYPLRRISAVIGRVMFPVYAKMQDDTDRFRNAYLKVAGAIALVTFPMMFGLWAVVEPLVLAVFGIQWKPVILLLMILAPVGMIQSIGTTVGAIYQAKGRTDWMFRWGIAAGVLIIFAFIIGLQWGIVGVATAYAIASLILVYPNFAIPFRLINLRVGDLWIGIRRTFMSSLFMMLTLLGVRAFLPAEISVRWQLTLLISVGCIAYASYSLIINRAQLSEVFAIIWPHGD